MPRDCAIGLALPIGVEARKIDRLEALTRELNDALDIIVGHEGCAGRLDLALQRRVFRRVEAILAFALAIHASLHDLGQVLRASLGASDERGDLLLLQHLPANEILDIGVIGVNYDHLGRAPRGAAGFDRAGRPVADLEKAHQA